jgi:threonine/homoserine/homoserine lactone efflux protein
VGQAIGQVLPLAVGVGLSPIPIVAVIVMLVTPRARVNGPAFLVGWVAGLTLVGVVVFLASNAARANDDGEPATWVDVLKLVLGLLLLVIALRQWRGRRRPGDEPEEPTWTRSVDHFTPPKAAGAGVVLSAANPKNLVLVARAARGLDEPEQRRDHDRAPARDRREADRRRDRRLLLVAAAPSLVRSRP